MSFVGRLTACLTAAVLCAVALFIRTSEPCRGGSPVPTPESLLAEIGWLRELAEAGDPLALAEALDSITVYIPAGVFPMGSDEARPDEQPRHDVILDPFYIDRYEVTNAQYRRFLLATGRPAPPYWVEGEYPTGQDDYPVVGVSWDDADAYCRWSEKRLPTEAEWEKACRGAGGATYPWGEVWDPARANVDPQAGFIPDVDPNAPGLEPWEAAWEILRRSPERADDCGLRPVGSFSGGASPHGVLDMAGNASEWVVDWYNWGGYEGFPAYNPLNAGPPWNHSLRGSAWYDPNGGPDWTSAQSRCSARNSSHELHDPRTGFRCARTAAP